MNWFQKLAQGGWNSQPYPQDIEHALEHLSDFLGYKPESYQLIPLALVAIESLPDDLSSWLETEPLGARIPDVQDDVSWQKIRQYLEQETSSRNFSFIVNAYRQGTLGPIIIHSDYGVLDGRGRVNFAYALGIPVMAFQLEVQLAG
ncbi:hypothetical protein LCGC14_2334740 [marine sediment metagenome]|uniref:Uncharacterized protein n=1 Tax=marine sediment metagenome TaxID=412755 RepID=A0A0F9D189_9ZZZZ